MRYGLKLTVEPTDEPVELSDVKTQGRIFGSDLDDYLYQAITDCRQFLEEQTGLAFINQTWEMSLDQWPAGRTEWWDGVREMPLSELKQSRPWVELSRFPLSSVSSVKVYDGDSTETTLTISDYFDVDTHSMKGRMALKQGATWPVALRPTNAIVISFVAGYGTAGANVPAALKRALRAMAVYMSNNEGCSSDKAYMDSGAREWVAPYAPVKL